MVLYSPIKVIKQVMCKLDKEFTKLLIKLDNMDINKVDKDKVDILMEAIVVVIQEIQSTTMIIAVTTEAGINNTMETPIVGGVGTLQEMKGTNITMTVEEAVMTMKREMGGRTVVEGEDEEAEEIAEEEVDTLRRIKDTRNIISIKDINSRNLI